jgi:hypothetical protein
MLAEEGETGEDLEVDSEVRLFCEPLSGHEAPNR